MSVAATIRIGRRYFGEKNLFGTLMDVIHRVPVTWIAITVDLTNQILVLKYFSRHVILIRRGCRYSIVNFLNLTVLITYLFNCNGFTHT